MHDIRRDSQNLPGTAPEGLLNKVRYYLPGIALIKYMATNNVVDGYHQQEVRALFYY